MFSVITCTGNRQAAFTLCAEYMARQTYSGPIQWIVVDDGGMPTSRHVKKYQDQLTIETVRFPNSHNGKNTLPRNLIGGLERVKYNKVLFMEDDDHYSPDYLTNMAHLLDRAPLAGQTPSRYYNVATRQYREFPSRKHASLCQTGIRAELIPQLTLCANAGGPIDMALWRNVPGGLLEPGSDVVGIKGMPGRPGIGVGHRPTCTWSVDPRLEVLRSWIGDDAAHYERFAERIAA